MREERFTGLAAGTLTVLLAACGGGSTPTAPPVASTPNLAPAPSPTPNPAPTPSPCTQGLCETPVTNTAPPVRVSTRLYWVRRPNTNDLLPCTEKDPLPVGWTFAVDLTAKDAAAKPTNGQGNVTWRFDGTERLVEEAYPNRFQPRFKIIAAGAFQIQGVLDGIRASWLHLKFVETEAEAPCTQKEATSLVSSSGTGAGRSGS